MKPSGFRRSQLEVKRIMEKMGRQPATFTDSTPTETPKQQSEWSTIEVLTIIFLSGVAVIVIAVAVFIFLDMWNRGMFDYLLR